MENLNRSSSEAHYLETAMKGYAFVADSIVDHMCTLNPTGFAMSPEQALEYGYAPDMVEQAVANGKPLIDGISVSQAVIMSMLATLISRSCRDPEQREEVLELHLKNLRECLRMDLGIDAVGQHELETLAKSELMRMPVDGEAH